MTKKKRAILTALSTRTRATMGSISGTRERRAEIAQRPVRQPAEGGDLRRGVLEDRPGCGVLAGQAEAVPQVAQDAPDRVGFAERPQTGAQALHAPLEIDHRPLELAVAAGRQRHVGAL